MRSAPAQEPLDLPSLLQEIVEGRHVPGATYRLQFHAGFTFRDALAIVPYLDALGITQAQVALEWSVSADTVSRWMTGKQPVPGWVSYALDGIEHARMRKRGDDRGYQWPPAGYE